ncbi:unnamed protein product [Ixodes persulcatus]
MSAASERTVYSYTVLCLKCTLWRGTRLKKCLSQVQKVAATFVFIHLKSNTQTHALTNREVEVRGLDSSQMNIGFQFGNVAHNLKVHVMSESTIQNLALALPFIPVANRRQLLK